MTESDKKLIKLAEKNLAKEFGDSTFEAIINNLVADADVKVSLPTTKQ